MTRRLLTQLGVRQRTHVVECGGSNRREQLLHGAVVEPQLDVEQNGNKGVGHRRGQQPRGHLKRVRHSLKAAGLAKEHDVPEERDREV